MEIWKTIIIPLLTGLIPALLVWHSDRPSIRRQKAKLWLDMLKKGEWKTAHPMLLRQAARDFYGRQVVPPYRTIMYALRRAFDGDKVMAEALRAGNLVRLEGGRFHDNRRWPKRRSSFRWWHRGFSVIGFSTYGCAIFLALIAPNVAQMIMAFLLAMLVFAVTLVVGASLQSAQALIELPEDSESGDNNSAPPKLLPPPANEEFVEIPVMQVKLRD